MCNPSCSNFGHEQKVQSLEGLKFNKTTNLLHVETLLKCLKCKLQVYNKYRTILENMSHEIRTLSDTWKNALIIRTEMYYLHSNLL